jgi:hypothetical protein
VSVEAQTLPLIESLRDDIHATLVAFFVVAAIFGVAIAWVRTRSGPPVVVALILGSVVVWSVANYQYVADKVDADGARLQQEHDPVPVDVPVRGG